MYLKIWIIMISDVLFWPVQELVLVKLKVLSKFQTINKDYPQIFPASNWELFHSSLSREFICGLEKEFKVSRSLISVSFELKIKYVILKIINNLGCKSMLTHLLFCNWIGNSKEMCQLCTCMVCSDEKLRDFLSTFDELFLEEILEDCKWGDKT